MTTRRKVDIMNNPLYMSPKEFGELATKVVEDSLKYHDGRAMHPYDLAVHFEVAVQVIGATMEHIIAKQHQMNRNTNGTN